MKKFDKPVRKIPEVRTGLGIKTVPEMLKMNAEKHADRAAYLTPRGNGVYTLTYGEVFEYVKRLSGRLKKSGLGKGDHIAILGENRPEWGIAYFSVVWIGATVIPLDARASQDFYKSVLKFSSAKAIVLSGLYLSNIKSAQNELPELRHIISMDDFDEIYNESSDETDMEKAAPDDLLEILFTSGTTGDPKGVMLTHGNIMSNVDDIYKIIDLSPDDRAFSVLPIHHSYECTVGFLMPFYNGMSVFYARSLKPNEMTEDLKTASPTIWLNTPLILEKLHSRINKELSRQNGFKKFMTSVLPRRFVGNKIKQRLGLEKIRFIVCGGAALPVSVSKGLEEFGFPLLQGYGLSESSPLITVNPPSNPKNESVGMVIPDDEVEIRDADDEGNGEIVARGPNIMKGYYKNESATKEILTTDGWLMTGDVGYFDEQGYLYITGRKKFVIVTKGGKNVYPEEIEEKLVKSPYIEEALVFAADDDSIQALIYPDAEEVKAKFSETDKEITDDTVWELIKPEVRKANETLEIHKRVRHFAIRHEEFPKTTTRKIKRHLFKGLSLKPETKAVK